MFVLFQDGLIDMNETLLNAQDDLIDMKEEDGEVQAPNKVKHKFSRLKLKFHVRDAKLHLCGMISFQ